MDGNDPFPVVQLKSAGASGASGLRGTNRQGRDVTDPTQQWFEHAMALYEQRGVHGAYFESMFGEVHARKRRADESALGNIIKAHIDQKWDRSPPWQGMDVSDFMFHIMYQCDACMGFRELTDTCSAIKSNTCTGQTCEVCQATKAHPDCVNTDCGFDGRTTVKPTITQSTDGTNPTQSTQGTTDGTQGTTDSTQGTRPTRPTKGTQGTDGTRPTKGTTDGTQGTRPTKGTQGTKPTKSTEGTKPTTGSTTQGTTKSNIDFSKYIFIFLCHNIMYSIYI